MKKRLLLFIMVFAGIAAAQSMEQRLLASKNPVVFDVVRSAAGGDKNVVWQDSDGSTAREINRSLTYDCKIRWGGKEPKEAMLRVYFLGGAGASDSVLDLYEEKLTMNPNSNMLVRVMSGEIHQSKANYNALGIKDRDGEKLRGAVAQLLIDGKIIRAYSSLPQWRGRAWNDPFK